MKTTVWPNTRLGKWSVALNTVFLVAVAASIVIVKGLGILSFGDHWWDVTVAIIFPASIIALPVGIIAVRKYHDKSVLVRGSICMGCCTILFVLLHSLFISD
jgi:hypothetical protein